MYQIRFGEHRKTYSNRIWYNVCTIFGRKLYHIRSEYGTFVPYSTEYGTFVPYSFLYQIRSNRAQRALVNKHQTGSSFHIHLKTKRQKSAYHCLFTDLVGYTCKTNFFLKVSCKVLLQRFCCCCNDILMAI